VLDARPLAKALGERMASQITISSDEQYSQIIALKNGADDYCLWKVEGDSCEIYFEYDSKINSGYNLVSECTLMLDGMHIVLNSGKLYHFYFNDIAIGDYKNLVASLESMYPKDLDVLDIVDR
jgi:hypothetical protein